MGRVLSLVPFRIVPFGILVCHCANAWHHERLLIEAVCTLHLNRSAVVPFHRKVKPTCGLIRCLPGRIEVVHLISSVEEVMQTCKFLFSIKFPIEFKRQLRAILVGLDF